MALTVPIYVPHSDYQEYPIAEMESRATKFYAEIRRRRTVRDFSDRPVPREIIEAACVRPGPRPMVPTCSRGTLWW